MVNLPGPIARAFEEAQKQQHEGAPNPAPGIEEEVVEPTEPELEEQPAEYEEPAPVEQKSDGEDWKKRFTGYKESADRTIHELRVLTTKLNSEMAMLRHQMESVQQQNQELRQSVPRDVIPKGVLSEDDIESLGTENAQRIAKITQAQIEAQRKEIDERLGHVASRLQAREQAEAEAQAQALVNEFWTQVQAIVPDAGEIDKDPRFAEFLNGAEDKSRRRWRDLGTAAKNAGDVIRMAGIYQEFKNRISPPTRDEQVTPRSAGSPVSSGQTQSGKRIWTQKEFEKEVYSVMRGGPMNAEKTKKIDELHAQFNLALRENRVRL